MHLYSSPEVLQASISPTIHIKLYTHTNKGTVGALTAARKVIWSSNRHYSCPSFLSSHAHACACNGVSHFNNICCSHGYGK